MHPVKNKEVSNIVIADLGGTWLKLRAMRDGAPLDDETIHPISIIKTIKPVASLSDLISEFAEKCLLNDYCLVITVPGFIDLDFDKVLYSNNIPELRGIYLRTELQSQLGRPVIVERDSVLTLLGECDSGVAHGQDDVLGIFFGTGIGAAFISEGRPFRGGGWALEIGHMPYGDNHILEDYGSGRTLVTLAKHHSLAVGDIFKSAQNRPDLAEVLQRFVSVQAYAIATAIALYSPKILVIGGGVIEMDGYPRDELVKKVHELVSPRNIRDPEIQWSSLGWRSALFGAANLLEKKTNGLDATVIPKYAPNP